MALPTSFGPMLTSLLAVSAFSASAASTASPKWDETTGRVLFPDGKTVAFDSGSGVLSREDGTRVDCSDTRIRDGIWRAQGADGAGPDADLLALGGGVTVMPGPAYQVGDQWYWGYTLALRPNQGSSTTEPVARVKIVGPCLDAWRQQVAAPTSSAPPYAQFTFTPSAKVGFTVWPGMPSSAPSPTPSAATAWASPPAGASSTSAIGGQGVYVEGGGVYGTNSWASSSDQDRCAQSGWFCNGYIYEGERWRWDGLSVSGTVHRKEPVSTTTIEAP